MSGTKINGFAKINDVVSIYRPPAISKSTQSDIASQPPRLIVICSWMGAASKHITKYTDGYRQVFPETTILLIQSTLYTFTFGYDLTPAVELIGSFAKDAGKGPIVLHAYSNGGANNATLLTKHLKENCSLLAFDKMILDSCPGRAELASGTRAVTLSLPNQYFVRTVGWYLVYLTLLIYKLANEALHIEDAVSRIRRNLNNTELFPQATPRLYLYSQGDAMVDFGDVHDHADEARQSGYKVVGELLFSKAPHCALLNENPERYWDAVKAHVTGDDTRVD